MSKVKTHKISIKNLIQQIRAIAVVTFREIIRERILWSTVLFTFFIFVLSLALSQLSIYESWRIALDFGLAGISLTGSLTAIVIGGGLVSREIKERTLYLILTKSLSRWQFIVGKLVGLYLVLFVNTVLMYIMLLLIYKISGGVFRINILQSFIFQMCEFFMLASTAMIFSVFSTSTLASIFTFSLWLIGHAMEDVLIAVQKIHSTALQKSILVIVRLLPDFSAFDIKEQVSHGIPVGLDHFSFSVFYALIFCLFTTAIACNIFSRRDL